MHRTALRGSATAATSAPPVLRCPWCRVPRDLAPMGALATYVLLGTLLGIYAIVDGITMMAIGRWRVVQTPESAPATGAQTTSTGAVVGEEGTGDLPSPVLAGAEAVVVVGTGPVRDEATSRRPGGVARGSDRAVPTHGGPVGRGGLRGRFLSGQRHPGPPRRGWARGRSALRPGGSPGSKPRLSERSRARPAGAQRGGNG